MLSTELTDTLCGNYSHMNLRLEEQASQIRQAASDHPTHTVGETLRNKLQDLYNKDAKNYCNDIIRYLIGSELLISEMNDIVDSIKNDTAISYNELFKSTSDISKIFPYYTESEQVSTYFDGMLLFQPGQRIGPGEMLLAIHGKRLTKGDKGDIITAEGTEVEVKGGKTPGRFKDQDLMGNVSAYDTKVSTFLEKYKELFPGVTKSGLTMAHLVDCIKNNRHLAHDIARDAADTICTLWNDDEFKKAIETALLAEEPDLALHFHGLANLKTYFKVKNSKMALLFIDASVRPAATHYVASFDDLKKHSNIKVTSAYPISLGARESFPKITATIK